LTGSYKFAGIWSSSRENIVNTSTPEKKSPKAGDFRWPGRFGFSRSREKRIPYLAGDARGEGGFFLIEVTIAMGAMVVG
jgi:hypothetical protein